MISVEDSIDWDIDWDIEEGWTECELARVEGSNTTVSISPDGSEVHIYGMIYFNEQEKILSKMKELQSEVK